VQRLGKEERSAEREGGEATFERKQRDSLPKRSGTSGGT